MENQYSNGNWIIKVSYPHGSHIMQWNDAPMRFKTQQEADARAEVLNGTTRGSPTHYIVVEDK